MDPPPPSPYFNPQANQHNIYQPPSQLPQYNFQTFPQYTFNPQYPPPPSSNPHFFPVSSQFSSHQSSQTFNVQPTVQNNNAQTQPRERGSNFTKDEDEALCKAWLHVSENPITGTDQTRKVLWDKILDEFIKILGTPTDRLSSGLSNRWTIIQGEINKYSAAARKVRPRSGYGVEDTIGAEKAMFYNDNKQRHFKLDGCWLILKDSPKWFHYNNEQEEKKKKINQRKKRLSSIVDVDGVEDVSNPSTPLGSATGGSVNLDDDESPFSQGSHKLQRPPGRKAAKAQRSNKNIDGVNLYTDHFCNMRQDQKEIAEMEMNMTRERDERKIQFKQEQEKMRREAKHEHERLKIEAFNDQERKRMEKEFMVTDPNSIPTEEGRAWLIGQQKSILGRWKAMQGGLGDD